MERIRVLIVDDSAIIRRLLTDALSADPAIEVVGIAANGKIALAKIPMLKPDLVTLDMEMPEMDGLETLTEIRKSHAKLPVIMFSTLTDRGATATLDALARGANDYVTKPSNTGSIELSIKKVQEDLIPKIKAFCIRSTGEPLASLGPTTGCRPGHPLVAAPRPLVAAPAQPAIKDKALGSDHRVDAVVIGTSTGGPNALSKVIAQLPADLPVPVLIVQHMPPIFTTRLAERLDQLSAIAVREAADGMRVQAGTVYVAPGDFHMKVQRKGTETAIQLTQEAPECSCRPAVDVLFRSASQLYGPNLLATVLTGMGQDGMIGCELIRAQGGYVLAQDEASSVVWGMPGAVTRAGLAHEILPLDAIARAIEFQVRRGRRSSITRLSGAISS